MQQSLAFEKEERGATLAQVETLRKEVAHLSSELEAVKASGATDEGDLAQLQQVRCLLCVCCCLLVIGCCCACCSVRDGLM